MVVVAEEVVLVPVRVPGVQVQAQGQGQEQGQVWLVQPAVYLHISM